jgi:hypothetical protein
LGSQLIGLVLFIGLHVPVSLSPLSTLIKYTDSDTVPEIHLSVFVGHLSDVFPVEEGPATTITASDGDPYFSVLLLFELGYGHLGLVMKTIIIFK